MAVTFVGATNASGLTTVTPALPTGWQENDLLVVAATFASLSAGPSGYTQIRQTTISTGRTLIAWYKVAGASESNPSVSGTGGAAICAAFRGTKTASVLDVESGQANTLSASTTAPGVTTTAANDLMIHAAGSDSGTATHTPPTGYTEPTNGDLALSGVNVTVALSYKIGQSQGATGNVTGTLSASPNNAAHLAAFFEDTGGGAVVALPFDVIWIGL